MNITEPSTMLTDYLLGGASLWWGIRLRRPDMALSERLWALALVVMGFAAISGGTYHGFQEIFPKTVLWITWRLTTITIGVAVFLLAIASLRRALQTSLRKYISGIFGTQLVAYCVLVMFFDSYALVVGNYAILMCCILGCHLYLWRGGAQASRWVIAGIGVSVVAALIQSSGLALHRHFNHNDFYHVVQLFGVYMFYQYGKQIGAPTVD